MKDLAGIDLSSVQGDVDYAGLIKLAIDYSDGVIQNSEHVNEEVMNYARSKNIPVLDFQSPDNYIDAFNEFYDKVYDNEQIL